MSNHLNSLDIYGLVILLPKRAGADFSPAPPTGHAGPHSAIHPVE